MLRNEQLRAAFDDVLGVASALRVAIYAIDAVEEDLAGTPHIHPLGDLRRVISLSEKRLDAAAIALDKIDVESLYGPPR